MIRFAATLLLGALAFTGCRGWESDQPPVHLIPNMDTQEKGRPYRADLGERATNVLPNNTWMQVPPDGTVSTEEQVDDDVMDTGMGADGQPSAKFPAGLKVVGADGKLDQAVVDRGLNRLQIYCSPCHGAQGLGDGTVAKRGGLLVPPPSFVDPRLVGLRAGKIYAAIRDGVNNNNMPSYAAQIPTRDRWAIVAAVRHLQLQKNPGMNVEGEGAPAVTVSATDKPTAKLGEQLYTSKGCVACHTTDGTPRVGPTFKGVYGKTEQTSAGAVTVDDAYIKESMLQPMAKIVNGFPPAMPPQVLNDVEQQSLVLYIQSLK